MPTSDELNDTFFARLYGGFMKAIQAPSNLVQEKLIKPFRIEPYPWYHQKYRRVPEIDQCATEDVLCVYEAEQQFKRDRRVDINIVRLLRRRRDDCFFHVVPRHRETCQPLVDAFELAQLNCFIKYGDMGIKQSAQIALLKQKHRLIFERRKRENYTPGPVKYIDDYDYMEGSHYVRK